MCLYTFVFLALNIIYVVGLFTNYALILSMIVTCTWCWNWGVFSYQKNVNHSTLLNPPNVLLILCHL